MQAMIDRLTEIIREEVELERRLEEVRREKKRISEGIVSEQERSREHEPVVTRKPPSASGDVAGANSQMVMSLFSSEEDLSAPEIVAILNGKLSRSQVASVLTSRHKAGDLERVSRGRFRLPKQTSQR